MKLVLIQDLEPFEMEDRELVSQILAGRTEEFRLLVERYQRPIFRFAMGLVGSREEAQDITQETFLAAYANLASYDASRAALKTWIYTIARNRCINWLKRNRHVPLSEPGTIESRESATPSLGSALSQQEISQKLDCALSALPVEQRSAFVLAEIEELPYAEIARIENTSLGTVKSRIHRAKRRLRSLLEPVVRDMQ